MSAATDKFLLFAAIIVVVVILSLDTTVEKEDDEYQEFVPTSQWQEIRENQIIPVGLKVKMDFETGKNYAKLRD